MSRNYEPFEIKIGPEQDGQFPISARFLGLVHESTISSDLPLLRAEEIEQACNWLERGFIDRPYAQDFGTRLFQTLFQPPIEQFFREALQRVEPDSGLRILLNQPLPEKLATLPWELLYDPGGLGFLARSARTPLVRNYTDLPLPHKLPKEGPLRVLVVTASPAGKPPISTQTEIDGITAALAKPKYKPLEMIRLAMGQLKNSFRRKGLRRLSTRQLVEVDVLKGARRADLQNRLLSGNNAGQPYHIVHFIGHAEHNEQGSFLYLEDGPIHADEFAEMVSEPSVNLVVLNACETAATGLLGSAAEACLRRSIPAVIGMQVPVLDQTAVKFAREFYTTWASGEPLESALAYARRLVSQDTPRAAADWSIPILYMGPEEGLQLQLKLPGVMIPWQMKVLRWIIAGVFSLLGITALLLQVPDIARAVRQQVPWVRCTYPYPLREDPSFNVAMLEFSMVDEAGRRTGGEDGRKVAQDLYRRLTASIDELNLPLSYDLGSAPYPCPIRGDSPEEIAKEAEQFAHKVRADILIYGLIIDHGEYGEINPEFYVNYEGFLQGIEVVGEHQIGKPLRVDLPIQEADLELGRNKALKARNTALVNLVIGLAEYSLDDYDAALEHFKAAEAEAGWLKSQGKEIVYLMIGNAYMSMADQVFILPEEAQDETRNAFLDQAQAAYEQALAINPQYARGQLGMASILYLWALGPLDGGEYDLGMLNQAEQQYSDLLSWSDIPVSAHIPAKVHFGLGQIYMVRGDYALKVMKENDSGRLPAGLIPAEEAFSRAAEEFEQVIDLRESGEVALDDLASQAYARLGMIDRMNGDFDGAVEKIKKAIELASPYYEVRFYALLGDTYRLAGDIERAILAYEEGIYSAEENSDEKSIEQLQEILDQIQP